MKNEVQQATNRWLVSQGYAVSHDDTEGNVLRSNRQTGNWVIALCEQQDSPWGFIRAFDRAMEVIIREHPAAGIGTKFGAALPIESTLRGEQLSYRKALKKYSRSVIFLDLGIHLLLVGEAMHLEVIDPSAANHYMQSLNRRVVSERTKKGDRHNY